jgi:hypothetical protein
MTGPVDDKLHIRTKLDLSAAVWHRSVGPAEADGPQLEHAFVQGYVAMRISQHPETSRTLIFTQAEWDAFVLGAKDGEFDAM